MKALAWYTAIFNLVIIILFILLAAGVVGTPPLTALEDILWAVFTVPSVILGVIVIRQRK